MDHHLALADTSDLCVEGTNYLWDAKTEIDDSPKKLYRVSKAGLEPGSVAIEAMTPPNSPQVAPSDIVTRGELRLLLTELLEIKNAQSNVEGKNPSSNEKLKTSEQSDDTPRVCASRMEYKTVNEVYVSCLFIMSITNQRIVGILRHTSTKSSIPLPVKT
jgi:hypothetical protein